MKKYGIIGFGDGASNVVANLCKSDLYDRIAVNTSKICLKTLDVDKKLLIGKKTCKGMGCGANSQTGQFAFKESKEEILKITENYEKIIVIACLGGGCATGCIIEFAKQVKNYYNMIVTIPFDYEGENRIQLAQNTTKELDKLKIKPLIIETNEMVEITDKKIAFGEFLKIIDEKIIEEVKKIIEK